ncbi:MAG: sulfite exporter TauE/SafE family protein [Gemmatimonadetes bacterium]|nr:sulfite exporter TauE/SafE family protein [Gemmatimonadota bacterium]
MSLTLALGVLTASLLGSVHCAGMCGGFVCFYSAGVGGRREGFTAHAAYNGGRLVSYLTLGAVAGLVGSGVERLGAMSGVSRAAAILSGTLMVGWGLSTLLAARGVRIPRLEGLPAGRNPLGALVGRVRERSPVVRAGAIGLLTTLLPCGWLYAFVFAAAGTGRVGSAMAMMALFWAGTLPVMVGVGVGAARLTGVLRARLPLITAAAVVVMGVLSITGRLRLAPGQMSARAAQLQPSGIPNAADRHQH